MSENLSSFLGNAESIPKRVMPIFFLIDTSGSMEGKKIGAVNSAIEELIPDLRHLSESQADSEIKLSVLKFSTGCEWVTPALMSLDAFDDWEQRPDRSGSCISGAERQAVQKWIHGPRRSIFRILCACHPAPL